MSLHYILDGYNILHKLPFPESRNLEQQREILIRFLDERRLQGSANNSVTIVFDGQPCLSGRQAEHYGSGSMRGSIRIIFTDGESADEKIKKMVADERSKGHIVVVTDDRGIRLSVRASGAKVLSVQQFIDLRPSAATSRAGSKRETMGQGVRDQIDEELKKIWLKKK